MRTALLATLFVLQKEHHENAPAVSIAALGLKTAQLCSFAFVGAAGGTSLLVPLAVASGATTVEWCVVRRGCANG